MRRLLLVLCLACVVATLSGWALLGAGGDGTAPGNDDVAAVNVAADTGDQAAEPSGSASQPCIVRADCAGGGLLVGQPLIVPGLLLVTMALVLIGQAPWTTATLNPALLAVRVDRPPRSS